MDVDLDGDIDMALRATRVAKHHAVAFGAGRALSVLVSPQGKHFLRLSRDPERTQEAPSLPSGWRLLARVSTEPLRLSLPNETLDIRADNGDSFQGPIPPADLGL